MFEYTSVTQFNKKRYVECVYNYTLYKIYVDDLCLPNSVSCFNNIDNEKPYFIVNGQCRSLYELCHMFSSYTPKVTRYKGLGENTPSTLAETADATEAAEPSAAIIISGSKGLSFFDAFKAQATCSSVKRALKTAAPRDLRRIMSTWIPEIPEDLETERYGKENNLAYLLCRSVFPRSIRAEKSAEADSQPQSRHSCC